MPNTVYQLIAAQPLPASGDDEDTPCRLPRDIAGRWRWAVSTGLDPWPMVSRSINLDIAQRRSRRWWPPTAMHLDSDAQMAAFHERFGATGGACLLACLRLRETIVFDGATCLVRFVSSVERRCSCWRGAAAILSPVVPPAVAALCPSRPPYMCATFLAYDFMLTGILVTYGALAVYCLACYHPTLTRRFRRLFRHGDLVFVALFVGLQRSHWDGCWFRPTSLYGPVGIRALTPDSL